MDNTLIAFTKIIYDFLGKKYTSTLKKDEFVKWCRKNLFGKGCTTIDDILLVLQEGLDAAPNSDKKKEENQEEG